MFHLATFSEEKLAIDWLSLPHLAASLFAGIVFLRWFHLAVRWGHAVGAPVSESPAAAVGSFFIPIMGLFVPYRISRALSETAPVDSWQRLWIGSQLAAFLPLVTGVNVNALVLLGAALSLAAAHFAMKVITEVTLTLT